MDIHEREHITAMVDPGHAVIQPEEINTIERAMARLDTESPLPRIEIGMRVEVSFKHPAARRIYTTQRNQGRVGIVRRENPMGRAMPGLPGIDTPGKLWFVELDATDRHPEQVEICIAGAALVPIDPAPESALTFDRVLEIGVCVETRGDLSRWNIGPEECVWLNEAEERLCEPGEEDGEDFGGLVAGLEGEE